MSVISEFKQFISRGNVLDLAVGIVIGAAFGSIVSSLVADILMPPLGLIIGGVDFTNLEFVIRDCIVDENGNTVPAVAIRYGKFLQTLFDFLIVAFAIFIVIKAANRLRKSEAKEEVAVPDSAEVILLKDIRDILKNK